MRHVPRLSTERLSLEPISSAHSQGMFDLWSKSAVCKYSGQVKDRFGAIIPMPAVSPADSDRIIEFWRVAAAEGWGFRWAILLSNTTEFVGTLGFNSLEECSEIAFHLMPAFWGKGMMSEACRAAIAWCQLKGASQIEAFIEPANTPSVLLASALGMQATDTFSDGARRYHMSISDQNR